MRLAVPLYVHPAVDPGSWDLIADHATEIDWVVVNAAHGPGASPDGVLGAGIERVREAGVVVLGYLDGAYGRRGAAQLVEELSRWSSWYGVRDAFVDQSPATDPDWVAGAVRELRAAGASRVVGNPGRDVPAESASPFDDVVVFEGPAAAHRAHGGSRIDVRGADSCHLVYGVQPEHVAETVERAHRAGVATVWVTGMAGRNPYHGVPGYVADVILAIRAVAGR